MRDSRQRLRTVVLFLFSLLSMLVSTVAVIAQSGSSATESLRAPILSFPDWDSIAGVEPGPELTATSAILIEVTNATALFAKEAERIIAPASLTKIVAIHVALAAACSGEIDLDDARPPHPDGWAANQPVDSSLLFLGPDQIVTTRELLAGLVVASGNDAAVELALRVGGTVAGFVDRMNATVSELGIDELFFYEPSGLSPANRSTVSAFGRFLLTHFSHFPNVLHDLYSLQQFTYPAEANRTSTAAMSPITQLNRNTLLIDYPGADGVKTGFIDESGYHLAATAVRDGRRLIAVVMGIHADSHNEGGRIRAREAAALLDYGFENFRLLEFDYPDIEPVRVFHGSIRESMPVGPPSLAVSVPVGTEGRLTGHIDYIGSVVAPLPAGRALGTIEVTLDGVTIGEADLASVEVGRGGLAGRIADAISLLIARIGRRPTPVPGAELEEASPTWSSETW